MKDLHPPTEPIKSVTDSEFVRGEPTPVLLQLL